MRKYPLIIFLLLFYACGTNSSDQTRSDPSGSKEVIQPAFQKIIDSALVRGAILIYDIQKNTYYSNDFTWAKQGRLPASTFKIPNSIIGFETGILENDSTLFNWNGEKRNMSIWEKDMTVREALKLSCVPCYQELARKIGVEKMRAYLDKLDYADMVFDSSTIDVFWLEGDSKISQFQQIDFLKRLYDSKLPISERSEDLLKSIMAINETQDYKLSGKTGWCIRDGHNNGWFVGFLEKEQKVYFFATNIDPQESFDMSGFPKIRAEITMKAFNIIINPD